MKLRFMSGKRTIEKINNKVDLASRFPGMSEAVDVMDSVCRTQNDH